jgi:hypothetical protein
VKALHDYQAQQDFELSFRQHAIITNVNMYPNGWWAGDYGGRKQCWFPSSCVELIEPGETDDNSVVIESVESSDDRVSCMFSFIVLHFNLLVQGFSNCGFI